MLDILLLIITKSDYCNQSSVQLGFKSDGIYQIDYITFEWKKSNEFAKVVNKSDIIEKTLD